MSWQLAFLVLLAVYSLIAVAFLFQIRKLNQRLRDASEREKERALRENDREEQHLQKHRDRELELRRYKRLAKTHLEQNEKFEKQRNQIWNMYRRSGVQAGRAQEWLLRELQNHVLLLNKYRAEKGEKPLEVDANLKDLVEDFATNHGTKRPETAPEELTR